MQNHIIQVKDLSYAVGEKHILSNISFSLSEGGFYALIGMNGSGKSTLLRCLNGNLALTYGSIQIKGKDIKKYSAKELACQVSTVSQRTEFLFDFSALQVVMMGRMCRQHRLQEDSPKDKEIVTQCMQMTNTTHLANRFIKQLSGGELQRIMIARALAQQSPIMLLDEPVSSLDILHSFEIMELLKRINTQSNITILIVLHNLSLTYQYAKECLVLQSGELKTKGTTQEILTPQQIAETFGVKAQITDKHILLLPKK
jgi:ABC-type cobalamin/Fe3+-siderophores transport systems, ATPase components